MLETNTFGTGDERTVFHVEDEHFSAGNERFENVHLNFLYTHTHTLATLYQQLPNRPYAERIAMGGITLSYSPPNIPHPQVIYWYTQ